MKMTGALRRIDSFSKASRPSREGTHKNGLRPVFVLSPESMYLQVASV